MQQRNVAGLKGAVFWSEIFTEAPSVHVLKTRLKEPICNIYGPPPLYRGWFFIMIQIC